MHFFCQQSVMASKHLNCVHITLDELVAESDSKSGRKVSVALFSLALESNKTNLT